MVPRLTFLFGIIIIIVAAIQPNAYAQKEQIMDDFVHEIRKSDFPAFWLSYVNRMERVERLGLIHGTTDNAQFCGQLADLYMKRFQSEIGRYFCEIAQ